MKPGRLLLAVLLATLALAITAPAAGHAAAGPERIVLAGIGGLRWSDVNRSDTPTLYELAGRGAIGMLSVRTAGDVTCPDDAWLTLSAGQRATAGCEAGSKSWADLAEAQRKVGYRTQIGLLGRTLHAAGVCATATGHGAELALTGATTQAGCRLTVADLGVLPNNNGKRKAAVRAADHQLAELTTTAGPNATVLVTGLSDEPDAATTSLRLGLAAGPGFERGWLGSSSTHQQGLAQLTDLTPTLTGLLGIRTGHQFVGSRWRTVGERPGNLDDAIARLNGFDTAERVIRGQSMWLFAGLAVIQLLGYGIAVFAKRRGTATIAALVAGATPVSAFLADLVPWPTAQHPAATLWIALLACIAVLATTAGLAARTRISWLAPTILAGVTAVVLATDVITGSKHQTGNLMTPGDLPVVGGRFFGFGNVAFSIFLTGALFLAGGISAQLNQKGRRAWPAALAIGAAAVLVDGWPDWGADFGGILAAVPAVVVLTAGIAGVRLTVKRVLLTALAAVAAVTLLAVADWLRPPQSRTHLGGFVQQVIDGDALPVVVRKAEMSIGTVTSGGPLAWLAIVILVAAAVVALRPQRFKANTLSDAYEAWRALRPTIHAVIVLGVVGFAVNDSGLIVPAVVFAVALPLTILAVTTTAARSVRQPRSAPPA